MKEHTNNSLVARNKLLITFDEAARRLSCSRYGLQRLLDAGEIGRSVLVGGCVRIRAKAVENCLRRRKVDEQRKRQGSMAQAMKWMLLTEGEAAMLAANSATRFSSNDPRRLP
jgi:excisionase family DNA binding protein